MAISAALIAFLADESQFSFAMQDILQVEAGIKNVRLYWDPSALPDEICGAQFRKTVPTGDRGVRPGIAPSRQEYSIFNGVAEVKYGLLRTANVESKLPGCNRIIDEKMGAIRACFLRSAHYFTVGRLANFVINDISEDVPTYGVDNTSNRERDFVVLPFKIQYERVMANFPAG